jgi:hypothetical protein
MQGSGFTVIRNDKLYIDDAGGILYRVLTFDHCPADEYKMQYTCMQLSHKILALIDISIKYQHLSIIKKNDLQLFLEPQILNYFFLN